MRTLRTAELEGHPLEHLRDGQADERPEAFSLDAATRDWSGLVLPDPLPGSDILTVLDAERADR